MALTFAEIEKKWQQIWKDSNYHKANLNDADKKCYTLVMFSYPSSAKLHVGHWFNYAPTDTWSRYRKMLGYNVFQPMGFDSFGLPAENYAIKTNTTIPKIPPRPILRISAVRFSALVPCMIGITKW